MHKLHLTVVTFSFLTVGFVLVNSIVFEMVAMLQTKIDWQHLCSTPLQATYIHIYTIKQTVHNKLNLRKNRLQFYTNIKNK